MSVNLCPSLRENVGLKLVLRKIKAWHINNQLFYDLGCFKASGRFMQRGCFPPFPHINDPSIAQTLVLGPASLVQPPLC